MMLWLMVVVVEMVLGKSPGAKTEILASERPKTPLDVDRSVWMGTLNRGV